MALDALVALQVRLLDAAGVTTLLSVLLTWRAWAGTSRMLREATDGRSQLGA
jgi:hypothetical protein